MDALRTTITIAVMAAACCGFTSTSTAATSSCATDSLQSTCEVLQSCEVIGAINTTEPPLDAVAFYRTCLFTDHGFRLVTTAAGSVARAQRTPSPAIYVSSFWRLYCDALQRAGQSDPSICNRRVHGSGTVRAVRRHRVRHRAPRFTG